MNTRQLFDHRHDVRQGLYQALDGLNADQLAFRPRAGLWSLHQVVLHIAVADMARILDSPHGTLNGSE